VEPPDPRSYTPKHLAEKILTSRSALEGERKQVTVLFADVKGSMDLAAQLDPEDCHAILDGFFGVFSDGVHRFEGTINHYAFLVNEDEFDQIFARIRERGVTYWADPYRRERGRINDWDGGRGVYFDDPNGHLLEVITRSYGTGGTTTSKIHPLFAPSGR
jgi:class 3 adenylate cyclase